MKKITVLLGSQLEVKIGQKVQLSIEKGEVGKLLDYDPITGQATVEVNDLLYDKIIPKSLQEQVKVQSHLKRYWLFASDQVVFYGGMSDFVGSYDSINDAKIAFKALDSSYYQVFDSYSQVVVEFEDYFSSKPLVQPSTLTNKSTQDFINVWKDINKN